MIIDIHAHLKRVEGVYQTQALLEDMDRYGIDMRVVSALSGRSIQAANQAVSDFAQEFPDRILACAYINAKLETAVEDTLHALALPNIHMLELNSFEDGYYPDSEAHVAEIFRLVNEKGLPIKVFSGIGAKAMPHQWEVVAKRFPDLTIIYLHMGCFDYGYACVDIVARNANALIETSNQYEMQVLRKAFGQLDPSKIVFGSLYPERLTSNGLDVFNLFDLSQSQKDMFFSQNAMRLLKL